jgi:hypothetical protein
MSDATMEIVLYGYRGRERAAEEIHRPTVLHFDAMFYFAFSSLSVVVIIIIIIIIIIMSVLLVKIAPLLDALRR